MEGKEIRGRQFEYVKWGNRTSGEVSKKIVLNAVDYDAELVFQTTEPGQEKPKFSDVCKVPVNQTEFAALADGLFKFAANEIQRKSFKAREAQSDTLLVDVAHIASDFHILRVRSYMKIKDGNSQRITKIMVHKVNGWDDIKTANKVAADQRNGSLGFSKDTCIFEVIVPPYPVIQGNWRDSQDIMLLNNLGKKLEFMFIKPSSYGSFLDRVYQANSDTNSMESGSQGGTTSVGKTVTIDDDDEMPF